MITNINREVLLLSTARSLVYLNLNSKLKGQIIGSKYWSWDSQLLSKGKLKEEGRERSGSFVYLFIVTEALKTKDHVLILYLRQGN